MRSYWLRLFAIAAADEKRTGSDLILDVSYGCTFFYCFRCLLDAVVDNRFRIHRVIPRQVSDADDAASGLRHHPELCQQAGSRDDLTAQTASR